MTIAAGVAPSPFGHCLIGASSEGICHLAFFEPGQRDTAMGAMRAAWPLAAIHWDDSRATELAARIFEPGVEKHQASPWQVVMRGTPFQLRIWRALLDVQVGSTISYGDLAAAAGCPGASRAAGSALAANSVAFLIPCHRVIRANGSIGHYRWGADRKKAMLNWERVGPPWHANAMTTKRL